MTLATDAGRHPDHPHAGRHHAVQFYDDDQVLAGRVAEFLADGVRYGDACVVIATAEHNAAFAAKLSSLGFDPGSVRFLDARTVLAQFFDGGEPDPRRFRQVIGAVLEEAGAPAKRIRAYGEMVDLLWRDGAPEAAIRLEGFWNDLAAHYPFSLLCAYAMGNFSGGATTGSFDLVCAAHTIVRPTERTDSSDAELRDRRIAMLEQRAAALEAEIAERKRLESGLAEALAARRRSEELLRDFVENATVGLHWVLADGTIEWANDAELKLLGYAREEYVGRNIRDFHADPKAIQEILCLLGQNEELHDYEAPLLAKDGTIRWVAISSNVLFENGEFVHTRCFSRDITARKRLEEQNELLLEATRVISLSLDYRSRLRDLLHVLVPRLADWCLIDLARDGGYDRLANADADSELEELGARLHERWQPRPEADAVRRVLESGQPIIVSQLTDAELQAMAGGEEQLAELRRLGLRSMMIVPMIAYGRVIGAISLLAADTRRQYTPDDLPLATHLASRAAAMIEIARLYHVAEESNRAKDEFLATLSHELRTPLTAILGWSRMLTMGGLDDETCRTAVATIEQSAQHQAALVEDLIDVSRVVSGKLALRNEPVDLQSVVGNVLHGMQLAADAKGIRLTCSAPDERLIVQGDATRLQQIVWNLLSNAVKFSEEGSRVDVRLEHDGGRSRIVVRDGGQGISPSFLPFIFEPFRQGDGTATRRHGGLGLGLAIVKYLVEAHGGTVSAESAGTGQGCTFTVMLPLARRPRAGAVAAEELADLAGLRVLVVDADPSSRKMLHTALGRCGAMVESADCVAAARLAVARNAPQFVITDIAMPGEDGMALLRDLRAGDQTRHIPVFALTAFHHRVDLQKEFDAFLEKPIDPMEVARRIARARAGH